MVRATPRGHFSGAQRSLCLLQGFLTWIKEYGVAGINLPRKPIHEHLHQPPYPFAPVKWRGVD